MGASLWSSQSSVEQEDADTRCQEELGVAGPLAGGSTCDRPDALIAVVLGAAESGPFTLHCTPLTDDVTVQVPADVGLTHPVLRHALHAPLVAVLVVPLVAALEAPQRGGEANEEGSGQESPAGGLHVLSLMHRKGRMEVSDDRVTPGQDVLLKAACCV